jgi:hypothetical protein
MPIAGPLMELCREILMDTEPLGNERLTLFSIPLGANGRDGRRKTFRDTNMWCSAMLPSPDKFVATGIKCAFFEPDGELIPISHPLYWTTSIELYISARRYWESTIAEVIDPILLTSVEHWNKLDQDRKVSLMRRFGTALCGELIPADRILVPSFPQDKRLDINQPAVEGVMIESQQNFHVVIDHEGKWPLVRILCVLQGTNWRPVF